MSSLVQILAQHGSLLVLDGSGMPQAVWFAQAGAPGRAARDEAEAGIGLFRAVAAVGVDPGQAGAFAFCEAPGSVLGIRTAAAAIRTWNALRPRPVYAYHALELAAAAAPRKQAYVADARRGFWHFHAAGQPVRRLATAELEDARGGLPLATLEGFRHWEPLPAGTAVEPYDLLPWLDATRQSDLFRRSEAPDAALFAQPSYVQWTPRIHQTP